MEAIEVIEKAVETYGPEAQTDMMMEEMSELIKALLKHRRNPSADTLANIREEMADVQIMLDQMRLIYGDYTQDIVFKLSRLSRRLGIGDEKSLKSNQKNTSNASQNN